jgi:hypothetical protein
MVSVYSLTPAPRTETEDALYAAWDQVQQARALPYDPENPEEWRTAIVELVEAISTPFALSVAHYKGDQEELDTLVSISTRVRDLLSSVRDADRPRLGDVLRISEALITLEIDIARLRNRSTPRPLEPVLGTEGELAGRARPASSACIHDRPWQVEVRTGRVFRTACTICSVA